jgi:hypothetical protein
MFGLMVLVVAGMYLLISVLVVRAAIGYARRNGKNPKRWAWSAALGMYLLVFWDWVPTVVAHKYYCSTEAGFWVYKTVDQWKAENPEVLETLVSNRGQVRDYVQDGDSYIRTGYMNQRFLYISKRNGRLLFNRWRKETEIVDGRTKEVLAREIDFYTSHEKPQAGWNGWKMWLYRERCGTYAHRDAGDISLIASELEGR